MGLITSYRASQAIHVAAMLGIAELLRDGPCDSRDLAALFDAAAFDLIAVHPTGSAWIPAW
jgi:hypothetical protein